MTYDSHFALSHVLSSDLGALSGHIGADDISSTLLLSVHN